MAELRVGEEAEAEYAEALAWYHQRSERAAAKFETVVGEKLEQIAKSPEQFPICDEEGFRFAILKRFPYRLIFRVAGDVVQIVAVAHSRRRPGYWSARE